MKFRINWILICVFAVLISCTKSDIDTSKDTRPNIILIMGDDMGYSDLGCFGGEIKTPILDGLAAKGLRYTQFYNAARCCPTRASLMTGLYPQQAGIGHMVSDRGTPAYKGDLSSNAVTIAEVLKTAGYDTYLSGKWHITPYEIENPDKKNWPRQRGFDKFFGMISGAGSFYDPRSLTLDNEYVAPREGFYSTTDFTDYAINCINEHENKNPYFMYVAYMAPHWPMHAPKEEITKYKGFYNSGWDEMRSSRYDRMKEMGLINPQWQLTPRDSFVDPWSNDIPDREWELANMETYAAMTSYMDMSIGRIVDALKEKGEYENTLILFLQDNGACAEKLNWIMNRPVDKEPLGSEDIQTEMVPHFTRDGKPVKGMKDAWPGGPESYTTYGVNWANASNTPFREYKHWVNEGGISTPLIAHWPEGIKDEGAFRKTPSHLIDIMATCIDLADAKYPKSHNNNSIIPLEGKSLVSTFDNDQLEREAIYWEHEGNRAVRMGKWKLVSKSSKKNSYIWDKTEEIQLEDWELYDMELDRTEMNNIASEHPDVTNKMVEMWMAWAKKVGAVPRPV